MLCLRRPDDDQIRQFLDSQASLTWTYAAVGGTAADIPPGYVLDHTRVLLGEGDAVFRAACSGLREWRQFDLGWVAAHRRDTPLFKGSTVAIVARLFGCWWLNACRIIYTIDEPGRFGFAYGTLPDHAEQGEERFLVEQDQDGAVWYDILAFSRPQKWLARIGYPYVRRVQKRFARDSCQAMKRWVTGAAD
ncbi:DUF1990 family protein [Lignipirellula cremea]|uniref:DUF1990 domain-containing protein n=1 Tax=Lignipirellula cremea TaxID=2528010 RepID=A0A518DRH7_9BACT|nr:DUF1990 domain-containing protein [Lignipirellula cremea]QDU94441.1 hypothetical protein Pla8534_22310 [Lignipirellula cremea]